MKQVLLLRHAKSSWDDSGLKDFDRPLAKRGIKDAPIMGKFAKDAGYQPAQIFSSPAKRAKQTTELFSEACKVDGEIIIWDDHLYYGSSRDYLQAIQGASDESERILLVGHNPLMESVAGMLSGEENKVAIRMPTAALVCLESYATRWNEVNHKTCQLKWMMIPKVLKKVAD